MGRFVSIHLLSLSVVLVPVMISCKQMPVRANVTSRDAAPLRSDYQNEQDVKRLEDERAGILVDSQLLEVAYENAAKIDIKKLDLDALMAQIPPSTMDDETNKLAKDLKISFDKGDHGNCAKIVNQLLDKFYLQKSKLNDRLVEIENQLSNLKKQTPNSKTPITKGGKEAPTQIPPIAKYPGKSGDLPANGKGGNVPSQSSTKDSAAQSKSNDSAAQSKSNDSAAQSKDSPSQSAGKDNPTQNSKS